MNRSEGGVAVDWARAKSVFCEVLEVGPDTRDSVLDGLVSDDVPLRKAVQTLLRAHERSDRFLVGRSAPSLDEPRVTEARERTGN